MASSQIYQTFWLPSPIIFGEFSSTVSQTH